MHWRMKYLTGNRSLRTKLLLIFLCMVTCLGSILGWFLYMNSSRLIIHKEMLQSQNELQQLRSNLESLFNEIDIITKDLAYRSSTQQILKSDLQPDYKGLSVYNQREMSKQIDGIMVSYYFRFQKIYIFNASGQYYTGSSGSTEDNQQFLSNLKETEFYQNILRQNGKLVLGPKLSQDQLVAGRLINNREDFSPAGLMIIFLKLSSLYELYDKYIDSGSTFVLFNSQGIPLSQRGEYPPVEKLVSNNGKNITINETDYLVSMASLHDHNWTLFKLTSTNYLLTSVRILKQTTILSVLFSILFFIPLSLFISSRITKPLKQLAHLMRNSVNRDFSGQAIHDSNDEIGLLTRSYNKMMQEINNLIKNEYMLNLANKENELKVMQAQINPHFLYNTLDTINWAARIQDADDIGDLAEALSKLMRVAISGSGEKYTIRDELEYIQNYLYIQKYRFEERFEVNIQVDPSVLSIPFPKLILQPLLENAIIHNMDSNENITRINLTIKRVGGRYIHIRLMDDGIGIAPNRLLQLQNSMNTNLPTQNHGLTNVHRRLVLHYGNERYGLRIFASRGTCIRFYIPIMGEGRSAHELQTANM